MELNQLDVWNVGMNLAVEIYTLVKFLPKEETYAMSDQMRRAAVSIPSNVAEGFKRNSEKEFIQFLSIASGSCSELETQLIICTKVGLLSKEQIKKSYNLCQIEQKKLGALISTLKRKN